MTETNPGTPDRTWVYVALAFVAFWGVYLVFFAPGGLRLEAEKPAGSRPADYSWTLYDLDDAPVEFSRFRGKTVFLNVWATWCPPCVQEMPSIAKLASNPNLKDVAFVCVSVDDSSATVKRFLAGKSWPMTVLRAQNTPAAFSTQGIPATFLIAPDGRIARSEVGSADWDDPKVISMLEGLASRNP